VTAIATDWLESIAAEPFSAVVIAIAVTLYWLGVRRLWRRAGRDRGVRTWQIASFAGGMLALSVALLSPLAELAERLLSAHMAQHELLMLIAAPLAVFGRPLLVWLWAFPSGPRDSISRLVTRRPLRRAWVFVTAPLAVFVLHAAAVWLWHMPALYEAAVADERVHVLQHLCFVLTAALFWWAMVEGRYGRAGYGVAVLYVFLTAIHTGVLGALLTVARQLWYPTYALRTAALHADALADQQLAGLVMWVPASIVFIFFGLGLLAAWIGEAERRVRLGSTAELATGTTGTTGPRNELSLASLLTNEKRT
jgi:cytochrome c oxidase assembly factor CtaG